MALPENAEKIGEARQLFSLGRSMHLPLFFRNVLKVLGGTALAQLLVLSSTPFLSRIYSPEAFALSQSFTAVISTLIAVACLRYDVALTVSSREETPSLLVLCAATLIFTSAILLIISPYLSGSFVKLFHTSTISRLGLLSAVGLAVSTALNGMIFLLIKERLFTSLASVRIIQSVGFVAVAFALGLAANSLVGIVFADVISRGLAFCVAFFLCMKLFGNLDPRLWISRIPRIMRKYRNFPLVSLPGGILGNLGGAFNAVWMLALFDASTAGSYAIVERLISAPVALIAGAVSQVYQGEILSARTGDPQAARTAFRRLLTMQIKIGAIPFSLLFLLSPWALPLFLGRQWAQAGLFSQVLAPFQFIVFVTFPFNMVLTVMERQHLQLVWEFTRFFLVSGCWFAARSLHATPIEALTVTAVAGGASYLLFLAMAYRSISRPRAP